MVDFVASTVLTAASLDAAFNAATLNVQTGSTYTIAAADQGEIIVGNNAGGLTLTIPTNAVLSLAVGTHVGVLNIGAGLLSVVGASGVTLTPAGTTLAQHEAATLLKTGTNAWSFVRGGFPKAVVSSSTAAAVTSVTAGGLPAKVYKFTGSGSITFATAGLVDVLAQGPGGFGSWGAGGAGGFVERTGVYVTAGAKLVYIGAGHAFTYTQGNTEASLFNGVAAIGGGNGASYYDRQPSGGACGGGSSALITLAAGTRSQGLIPVIAGVTRGGNGAAVNGGGGGGVAADASGGTGGAGTTPDASWGSPGVLGQGGGGASMTANTGNGGNTNANGNSGLVLVRVFD